MVSIYMWCDIKHAMKHVSQNESFGLLLQREEWVTQKSLGWLTSCAAFPGKMIVTGGWPTSNNWRKLSAMEKAKWLVKFWRDHTLFLLLAKYLHYISAFKCASDSQIITISFHTWFDCTWPKCGSLPENFSVSPAHFSLYSQPSSFSHYPQLVTIGEGWDLASPYDSAFSSPQRTGTVPTLLPSLIHKAHVD